ncbi:MAG: hypothetical protein SD837_20735 [Candidatus Electrothrix scaldis]|nr:MAG: hypothetical protein SD837_20735 [Candidatus Electrothrix sp. GW3-3]
MEWLIENLRYFIDHPEVTWSGAGVTAATISFLFIKNFFSFFAGKKKSFSTDSTPQINIITSTHQKDKAEKKQSFKSTSNNFKLYGILVITIGIAILIIFPRYASHAKELHKAIGLFNLFAFFLGIIIFTLSHRESHSSLLKSRELFILQKYSASRLVILFLCSSLLLYAHIRFNTQLIEIAQQNTFLSFLDKYLSGYGVRFITIHIFGFVIICSLSIISFIALLYYLFALLSLKDKNSNRLIFFDFFTEITEPFSGKSFFFVSLVLLFSFTYLWISTPYKRNVIEKKENTTKQFNVIF